MINITKIYNIIGIYKITSPNNKIYIGQTVNWGKRKKKYLNLTCKFQTKLYNSFLKYGVENHKFEIIEECSKDLLNEREIFWGLFYNVLDRESGLNLRLGDGRGSCSEETKEKISKANKGKPKPIGFGKDPLINKLKGEKISKALLGREVSEETRLKIRLFKKGSKDSKETILLKIKKRQIPILQFDKQGNFIKEWGSAKLAGIELKIDNGSISRCCKNKIKSAGKFIWKYKEN